MHTRWTPAPLHVLLAGVAGIVALSGCTTRSQVFEGYGDDQLWTAMVASARSPDYDDWKVSENEVFVDNASRRIEIYRYLKRTFVSPYSDPRKETEEWRFQIMLARDEELGQPTVDFTARQITVPAHVWREAERYFLQVRSLLGPAAAPSKAASSERGTEPPIMPAPLEPDAATSTPGQPTPSDTKPAGEPSQPASAPPVDLPER